VEIVAQNKKTKVTGNIADAYHQRDLRKNKLGKDTVFGKTIACRSC
jgi:hypothetical protein